MPPPAAPGCGSARPATAASTNCGPAGSGHFLYVCFSDDAAGCRQPLDPAVLGTAEGRLLQELVGEAIAHLQAAGRLESLAIYPLQRLSLLSADLAVEEAHHDDDGDALRFRVANRVDLEVSDVGIAVVIDDRYSDHRYLRLPWLAAGASQSFRLTLPLPPGQHEVLVLADPERDVLEPQDRRANSGLRLVLEGGHH